jgi:hypothetical protein
MTTVSIADAITALPDLLHRTQTESILIRGIDRTDTMLLPLHFKNAIER